MKAKDLIEKLKEVDEDARVIVGKACEDADSIMSYEALGEKTVRLYQQSECITVTADNSIKINAERTVNICGLKHKIIECEDNFNIDCHMGMIDYPKLEIKINKNMAEEAKEETICHEMVHGILVHLGEIEMSNDERLVQALGNAIYQGFKLR